MLVQIYSLTHPDDVAACVEAGVDHIGVVAGDQALPAAVSNARARTLFEAIPATCRSVALTVATDVEAIIDYARALEPDILHLSSAPERVPVPAMQTLRARLPDIELMKAIDVTAETAVATAERFAPVSDWLLLDTVTDAVEGVGASGETHDWTVSRHIVDTVDVPVILAGGLSPENVAEAIRAVDPAGVDSYTHTSRTETRKDHDRVAAFVDNARVAASDEPRP
ncbi:MAG: hypothetical protein ABEJ57_00915 [Halobacteriaceae archaeon]